MQPVRNALYGTPAKWTIRSSDWLCMQPVTFKMHCICDIKYDHCTAYYTAQRLKAPAICSCWCWLKNYKTVQWCMRILQSITGVCSVHLCSVIRAVIHFVSCKWYFIETLIEINDEKLQFTFPDGIEWIINLDCANARRMFWMCANVVTTHKSLLCTQSVVCSTYLSAAISTHYSYIYICTFIFI